MSNTADNQKAENIDEKIRDLVVKKGITRLCHFTQSRNLAHIFGDGLGICSTYELKKEQLPYNHTDEARYDRHPELICCSVEFPNVFYFATSRKRVQLFEDWAVLLIDPKYIYRKDTVYCPCNAAKGGGAHLCKGIDGFESLYALHPQGSKFPRSAKRMEAAPTDIQAEVLVDGPIALEDIIGVVFFSVEQARRELLRLELMQAALPDGCKVYISKDFYDNENLDDKIRNNRSLDIVELLSDGSTKEASFTPHLGSGADTKAKDTSANAADSDEDDEEHNNDKQYKDASSHSTSSPQNTQEALKYIKAGVNEGCVVYSRSYSLNQEQTYALFLPTSGINLVRGASGSGKTLLSVLRAVYLSSEEINDNAGKTLLITRNAQLMQVMQNSLSQKSLAKIDVNTFRSLISEDVKAYLAHQRGVSLEAIKNTVLLCTGKVRKGLVTDAMNEVKRSYPEFVDFDDYLLCNEEIKIITLEGFDTLDEYLDFIQLRSAKPHELIDEDVDQGSFYEFIFKTAQLYKRMVENSKYAYDANLMHYIWSRLKPTFMISSEYKHIIIDDANNVPSCMIKAIADNLEPGSSLTLFADKLGFRTYPIYIETEEFKSRAHCASLNCYLRCATQVFKLAHHLAYKHKQISSDKERYINKFEDNKPSLFKANCSSQEDTYINYLASKYQDNKSIAFLTHSSAHIKRLCTVLPHAQKITETSTLELDMPKGVYIGSMLETKGLTFDVVCLPFLSVSEFDTQFNEGSTLTAVRAIYSSITCASELLYVVCKDEIFYSYIPCKSGYMHGACKDDITAYLSDLSNYFEEV